MSQELLVYSANSWAGSLDKVEEARSLLARDRSEEIWYRGVSSQKYRLVASLLRYFEKKKQRPTAAKVCDLESDLFFEFLAKARTGDGAALNHWDVLFLMQHYRARTRLLDWTEVPYVALYFAVAHRKAGETPRLYLMNPYSERGTHRVQRPILAALLRLRQEGEGRRRSTTNIVKFSFHHSRVRPRPLDEISPGLIAAIDLEPAALNGFPAPL